MSKLTDFFPKAKGSDYGVSGDPPYFMDLLLIGGGSGASIQCFNIPFNSPVGPCACLFSYANYSTEPSQPYLWGRRVTQGTGGGIYIGRNVAVYSGVSIPITVGAAGANSPNAIPVAGTPTGKGSPGSPTTFGCLTAYGGGAPATIGPAAWNCCVIADSGGIGGEGWGRSPCQNIGSGSGFGFSWWHHHIAPQAAHTRGISYNFANMFGVHRGSIRQNSGAFICSQGYAPYGNDPSSFDPKYPCLATCSCSMSNFYCLNVNNVSVLAGAGHSPVGIAYTALNNTFGYDGYATLLGTGVGITKCAHWSQKCCGLTPFAGYNYTSYPPSCAIQYCPNTGTGGDGGSNATGGAVWLVYPNAYPAASSFTGGVDCTPCVKTGYRAYRWFSPGSFTMP